MRLDATILKAPLLGTKNVKFDPTLLPVAIQAHLKLDQTEEKILLDALTFYIHYIRCGRLLPAFEGFAVNHICDEESLPYASVQYQNFLSLLLRSSPEALECYLEAFVALVRGRGEILPPEYLMELESKIKQNPHYHEALMAFGKRGEWLYKRFHNPQNTPILEMNAAQRKGYFAQILDDIPTAIAFLDEVFDAESPAMKFSYLKLLSTDKRYPDETLLAYFDNKITPHSTTTKTYRSMDGYLKLLRLSNPSSSLFQEYFATVFSRIWEKQTSIFNRSGKLIPKELVELTTLLAPLEELELEGYYSFPIDLVGVDKHLYFVITAVPAKMWAEYFDIPLANVIASIKGLKTQVSKAKSNNKIEHLNYLDALNTNLVKYAQKDVALILFELYGLQYIKKDFLRLLSDEEVFALLGKSMNAFDRDENLLRLLGKELKIRSKWSKEFTQMIFDHSFGRYQDNSIKRDLWLNAPYFDDDFLKIVETLDTQKHYSNNLYETLYEIEQIKKTFQTLQQEQK